MQSIGDSLPLLQSEETTKVCATDRHLKCTLRCRMFRGEGRWTSVGTSGVTR